MLNHEFPPLGGGGGVAAHALAIGFIEHGYVVDYITSRFQGLQSFENVDGINTHRIRVIGRRRLATASFFSLLTYLCGAFVKAFFLLRKQEYQFINAHFTLPAGIAAIILSRLFRVPVILTVHGGDIFDPSKWSSPHRHAALRGIVRWVLDRSHVVVAQSEDMRQRISQYYGYPHDQIALIPLPYRPILFVPTTREALSLSQDMRYIVCVGRLVARKRFEDVITAISRISDPRIELLIIGEGPGGERLLALARELKIEQRVHFLGRLSDELKMQYLLLADLFVLCSSHEGFGVVLFEAMQAGLPLVITNEGGQNDIGKYYPLVRSVSPQDVAQLAYAISETLALPRQQPDPRVLASFAPARIAGLYLDLLKCEH